MIETVNPLEIEERSFAIITELLGDHQPDEETAPVVKRVIHTTADFDYRENLVFSEHAVRKGIEALRSPYVAGVRGMGLMVGVGVQGMTHKELRDRLMAKGLLTLTAGKDTLRLLPPLVISEEEIDLGLAIMAQVMQEG